GDGPDCGNGIRKALPCEPTPTCSSSAPLRRSMPPCDPPTTALDPAMQANLTLLELVAEDSAYVDANLTGAYVVQLNAKYLDGIDQLDGRFYDAQAIIDLYRELDARYGDIAIITADDYSSNSYPGLYQMLLKQRFASKAAGSAQCEQMGLGIDA